jgi:hypothetical protein
MGAQHHDRLADVGRKFNFNFNFSEVSQLLEVSYWTKLQKCGCRTEFQGES